ncbi:MerR family transcriptional regulator [Nocardia gipuzkoensis]|uniref:MerR family transcriptional regulator n=1 Tax=Nocardia gipuzkoensis TaxID=2749991 RepID=UPI001E3B35E4|nr:MerR family transcriptional regulator [Nocardia gipuzkoensis]UGT66649.1 MerR family transcriptional regulator [Nocardia gipuzkoensis]
MGSTAEMPEGESQGIVLTIERAFVGIAVTTVRSYRRLGLLDEPELDSSGCRRYGPAKLLRLVQVRALTGAGLPPTEVGDLLDYFAHVERVLGG